MRERLLRGFAQTAAGSAAVAVVSLVRNVVIARVMGPAAFGLWNFCGIGLRLTVESHLGALSTLSAEVPVLRGAGRADAARDLERRASGATMLYAIPAALVAAIALRAIGGPHLTIAALVVVSTAILQQQFFADCSTLRARGIFGNVALAQAAFAALHLVLLFVLVPEHYLTGALIAWSAALVLAILVMRLRPREPLPAPLPRVAGDVIVRGLPTWLVGVTFTLLLQTDRAIVGALLGTEALGHYGIMGLCATALLLVPDALGGVLWPLAGETYGRAGEDPRALSRLADRSFRGLAVLLACALCAALAATDVIVAWKLPLYAPALGAVRPYLGGVYLLALTVPLRWLLVTVRSGRLVLAAHVGALVAAAALEIAACVGGFGITGVAWTSAIAAVLLLASMLVASARRTLLTGSLAARLLVESLVLVAAALGADAVLASAPWWMRIAAPSLAGAAALVFLMRRVRPRA